MFNVMFKIEKKIIFFAQYYNIIQLYFINNSLYIYIDYFKIILINSEICKIIFDIFMPNLDLI